MKCRDRQCWVSTFYSVRSVFVVSHCIAELTWTSSLIEIYLIFSFLTSLKSVQSDVFLIFLIRYLLYFLFISFFPIIIESPTCAYYSSDIYLSIFIATLCLRSEINSILIVLWCLRWWRIVFLYCNVFPISISSNALCKIREWSVTTSQLYSLFILRWVQHDEFIRSPSKR